MTPSAIAVHTLYYLRSVELRSVEKIQTYETALVVSDAAKYVLAPILIR